MNKRRRKKKSIFHPQMVAVALLLGVMAGGVWGFFITQSLKPKSLALLLAPQASRVLQGEPVEIEIQGTTSPKAVVSAAARWSGGSSELHFGKYAEHLVAFYGVPVTRKAGTTTVSVLLANGKNFTEDFYVAVRPKPSEYFPVPAKLGGNSVASQENLVSVLSKENARLKTLFSTSTSLWTGAFAFPVKRPRVTDTYGRTRDSGAAAIMHEGVDFSAAPGTPVYAINGGEVEIAEAFVAYGNTVVVDHGLGVQSFYMHLSSMTVAPGEMVERGELVGYAGETGYSEGAHLHLSIKIGGVSIDPLKFFALFGVKI
jgi:murein DD-endopeptidase MepM/ murein hydrolase activator NlpD